MLIRHSAIYIVAKLVPGLLGLAVTALLTRTLAPAEYGLYALALLLMTFGSSFVFDWLGLAYLRVAQQRSDPTLASSTFAQLYAALVAATALIGAVALASGVVARPGIVAAGLLMTWTYSWFELVARFHVAKLSPGAYLRMNIGRGLLTLIGAGGAALATRDAVWTAYGTAASMLLGAALGGIGHYRLGRAGFDAALARSALRFGLPLAASLLLAGLRLSGTRALVDWLVSIEALGLYTAGFLLVQNTLGILAAGVAAAGFSLAVRAVDSGDPTAAQRQLKANGTLLLAVLAPASLGMALTASNLAATLVGPRFVATVAALTPWMAAGALFAGFRAHYLDHAFQLGRHPQRQVWVTAGGAAVTLALDLLLIPRFGPLGAAIAVATGAATSMLHALWAGRAAYALPRPAIGRIAAACLVMSACVVSLGGAGFAALVLQVVGGALAYAASAVALDVLGVRTQALVVIARILRRKPQAA